MKLLDRILLSNYSLAVFLSRKKKNVLVEGTCSLFSHELFFFLCSITALLVVRIPHHFSDFELLLILIILFVFSFYGIIKWIKYYINIKKGNVKEQYKLLKGKTFIYTLSGWILFIGSFIAMLITFTYTIEGYSLQ